MSHGGPRAGAGRPRIWATKPVARTLRMSEEAWATLDALTIVLGSSTSQAAANGYQFVPEVAPREQDILLPKKHPSAFFGTPLVSYLVDLGVDSLVVTGCTTSGCVRGSVVDGFAYNFRCTVPIECVYDRSATSHAVNLFDMAAKYADVKPVAEVMAELRALGAK